MPDDPPERPLAWIGLRLSVVSNRYAYPLYAALEQEFGLLRDEAAVIISVSSRDGPTAQDVVNYTSRPKNSISRAVRRLEEDGVIRREGDAQDRRMSRLYLTENGASVFRAIRGHFEERDLAMMQVLTTAEQLEFNRLLVKISERSTDWV